jgi:hypothetical protein
MALLALAHGCLMAKMKRRIEEADVVQQTTKPAAGCFCNTSQLYEEEQTQCGICTVIVFYVST